MIDLSFWKIAAKKWTKEAAIIDAPDVVQIEKENEGESMLDLLLSGGADLLGDFEL